MSTELVRVFAGRPSILKKGPVTVFISVHDQAFFDARKTWKARLRDAHPDRGGRQASFRKLFKSYSTWLQEELKWYANYGIEPPLPIKEEIEIEPEPILNLPAAPLCWCGKPVHPSYKGASVGWNKTCSHHHGQILGRANQLGISPQEYEQIALNRREQCL
jgi:hypothetical protein